MKTSMRHWLSLLLLHSLALCAWAQETALDRYVAKPDTNYSFFHYATDADLLATTYFLSLTSQQWRNSSEVDRVLWQHDLSITVPKLLSPNSPRTALLLIDGGSNNGNPPTKSDDTITTVAAATGSIIASVRQVPNQPLSFTDEVNRPRSEDAILAYSMDKYLDTGDAEWPVHLAMTKAAVRAMDAVQSFAAANSLPRIDDFIVLGGSKRGWTTWLVAAVDPRVKAILPISIDMLNLGQQFTHHWEAYGHYAPILKDYVEFDLPCRLQTAQGRALLNIVDPYTYRARYTMPKFVANSTGDQFFLSDSSRFYFADLLQPKQLRYTPNTDHTQNINVILTAATWIDDIKEGNTGPRYSWAFEPDGSIQVQTQDRPNRVRLWQATNPNARDFRLEAIGPAWTSTELQDTGNGVYIGFAPPPAKGWTAFMVELTYAEGGVKADQVYTTDVRVTPDTLPFKGTHCNGLPPPRTTVTLYDQTAAKFFLRKANAAGPADVTFAYGPPNAGWLPVSGDWNGDGFTTGGLYDPVHAKFYLRNSNTAGVANIAFEYGPPNAGWLPIAGDWNGDGVTTVGLYDPVHAKFYLRNSNTAGVANVAFEYGPPGSDWLPIAGDWNGDGITTVGLYDPAHSRIYLRNSNTAGVADTTFTFGPSGKGWLPVTGRWQ